VQESVTLVKPKFPGKDISVVVAAKKSTNEMLIFGTLE
jgi:hypothetical protein